MIDGCAPIAGGAAVPKAGACSAVLTATMPVGVGGNVFCLSVVLAVLLLLMLLLHKLPQWH